MPNETSIGLQECSGTFSLPDAELLPDLELRKLSFQTYLKRIISRCKYFEVFVDKAQIALQT